MAKKRKPRSKLHPRFTDHVEFMILKPGDPTPENALERAERVLREREAEQQRTQQGDAGRDFTDVETAPGAPLRFDRDGNRIN